MQFDLITSFSDEKDEGLTNPKSENFLEGDDTYKYILVMLDVFTGYVLLRPLINRSARKLTEAIWDICCNLGVPKILQSDCESAYLSEITTGFIRKLGAQQIAIAPFQHHELGKTERAIKTASTTIRKLLGGTG